MKTIKIIGGGLAGSEAAYQLLKRGYGVRLYEMRPIKSTPAHNTGRLAELVCSNSLKSTVLTSAQGVLKGELEYMDSLILKCAKRAAVPAGAALAVDRDIFADEVEKELLSYKNLEIVREEVVDIEEDTIIASGPLTSDRLALSLQEKVGNEYLGFFDAVAPILTLESVDKSKAFYGARYGKGDDDYLNCPLSEEEYKRFWTELVNAELHDVHDVDKKEVFEGCMPVEVMAKRGEDSLRFGPLRPVGLNDPRTGKRAYAVVQLRQENANGTLVNIVGFQTNLRECEQRRVFGLIPALENAEFVRYGRMHRNTYLNAPNCLEYGLKVKNSGRIFVAGQLSGVEGYMESTLSGLLAGINMARSLEGKEISIPNEYTVSGSLMRYLTVPNKSFAPMHVSFELLPPLENDVRDKRERKLRKASIALDNIKLFEL